MNNSFLKINYIQAFLFTKINNENEFQAKETVQSHFIVFLITLFEQLQYSKYQQSRSKKIEHCKKYISVRNSIKSNEIDFFECFPFQCYF